MTRPYTADQCLDFASTLEKDVNGPASRLHGMNFTGEIAALRQAAAQARVITEMQAWIQRQFHTSGGVELPNGCARFCASCNTYRRTRKHLADLCHAHGLTAQETTDGD